MLPSNVDPTERPIFCQCLMCRRFHFFDWAKNGVTFKGDAISILSGSKMGTCNALRVYVHFVHCDLSRAAEAAMRRGVREVWK
jgi:hypothetical protein